MASGILAAVGARRAQRPPRRRAGDDADGAGGRTGVRPPGRRQWIGRIAIAAVVFAGATAIPLGLEILWRSDGDPGSHVQPEVTVIERGGQTIVKGKDPYHEVTNPDGKVVYHARGESTVEPSCPTCPS